MGEYYCRTIDCIDYVQAKVQGRDGASKIHLNRRQCECVVQELLDVSKSLKHRGAANLGQSCQRTALLHLHATVKRAQMLVDKCCCERSSWLAAALTLGDAKEEVMAILSDLHMWAFVLEMNGSASPGGSESSQSQQSLEIGENRYQGLSKELQSVIQDAARQDQASFEETLNSPREENQHDDDTIRRVYLKSRLTHSSTERDLESVPELKEYKVLNELGFGSSGMVLAVRWLGQDLALKKLKGIDRTEATALGQVQHPNIVRLFHYWEDLDPPRSCIAMDLMARDLREEITRKLGEQSNLPSSSAACRMGPFSLPVAIDIMLQVAQAMRELHEKKLTHRDLKTSNILVRPVSEEYLELHSQGYLEVKLADFGLAKAYANTSQSGDLTRNTGTTVYGAPEIFEREKILRKRNFPPKADIWSYGMTFSEVLTGNLPFENELEKRATLHTRIRSGLRPGLPEDCPEYLKFCIKSCWELEPQRRPSFSDLCRMLKHAKLLSLGLMDVESSKSLFAYQTSARVTKSRSVRSLHLQEEPKVPRCNFKLLGCHMVWRNSRRVGSGSARSRQALLIDSGDQSPEHLKEIPDKSGGISYKYEMLLDIDIETK